MKSKGVDSTCYHDKRDQPLQEYLADTLDSRLARANRKIANLCDLSYTLEHMHMHTHMWECEFNRLKKVTQAIAAAVCDHPVLHLAPLNLRNAFYSGRTGNMKTYHRVHAVW